MSTHIAESDWKIFRELSAVALDRFCERVLAEIARVSTEQGKSNHERYLTVFRLVHDRNKELAAAFDDSRRSTAVRQLARIQALGLLTDDEMARFGPQTREAVQFLLGLTRD